MKKNRIIVSLVLNIYIVVSMLFCLARFLTATGEGNMKVHGAEAFRFFTVDSNVLMAIVALGLFFHQIWMLKDPGHRLPRCLELLNYIATVSVAVTFVTVCTILGPAAGFLSMFTGNNFMMHLVNPLAAIISFMFFAANWKITWKQTFLSLLPTLVYGTLYFILVVAVGEKKGGWNDFYYFNTTTPWYVSYPVMQIMGFLIGLGLRAVHNLRIPEIRTEKGNKKRSRT